ncbi:hypothetical protein BDZ94DRAFT_1318056 [Collybia nuda]|uniref:F-box domain-containing protein n=1 Tax=Collybia nuda TaxID=64659 RepID=A0A9P6CPV8_9AGAR|nr:hypothetical protein BDZ94DRAFT_1318056 [Collybia nuda]
MMTTKYKGLDWANKLRVESAACSSNEILPDQDQSVLHVLLAEAQGELDTLSTEIPRLQALLDNHKQRRAASIERVTRLRMGIAPHKKLPPELLARIFVESMDRGSVDLPLGGLPLPWVLAQVCSRWRMISRSEPLLWSRLYISTLHTYRRKRSVVPLIKDILSNHGGRGRVELTIGALTNGEWSEVPAFFQAHSSRVWKLNLAFGSQTFPIRALSEPLHLFDELQSLSLSLYRGDLLGHESQAFYGFSTARNLFELKINISPQLSRSINLNGDMLPWAQLTSLTLSNMTAAPILTFLTYCPLLINLVVKLPNARSHVSSSVVSLHQIQSLSITGSTCPHFGEILAGLMAPSLKKICLIKRSYQNDPLCLDDPLIMNLTTLLTRSRCDVDSFQTDSLVIKPTDMITLMRAMPALTDWSIPTQSYIPESILSTILDEGLVPNLRIVKGWEVQSVHSILHFLNNRWSPTPSGEYKGIQHSTLNIKMPNYSLSDRKYFKNILPELQTHGRRIQLRMGYH